MTPSRSTSRSTEAGTATTRQPLQPSILRLWGSPVGAVRLAMRAVNEVKQDWARLLLGWVTQLTVSIGLWLWADQLRP